MSLSILRIRKLQAIVEPPQPTDLGRESLRRRRAEEVVRMQPGMPFPIVSTTPSYAALLAVPPSARVPSREARPGLSLTSH